MAIYAMHMFQAPELPVGGKWHGFSVGRRKVIGIAASGWPVVWAGPRHTVCIDKNGMERMRGVSEAYDSDRDIFMEDKLGRLSGYRRDDFGDWRPDESVIAELTAVSGATSAVERREQVRTGRWSLVPQNVKDVLQGWVVAVSGGVPSANLFLHGSPGCGKTTTLTALADELREQGTPCHSITAIELATLTRDGYARADKRQDADSLWTGLRDAPVAIVDDLSAGLRPTDADLWTKMQGVLDHRARTGAPVIFADNNGAKALAASGLEPRIVDRLKLFQPVAFTNASHRKPVGRSNPNGGGHD